MRGLLGAFGRSSILSIIIGDATGGVVMTAFVETLIHASYSQEAETNADQYAIDLFNNNNISNGYLAIFFEKIRDEYGDVEGVWSHFSSHPQLQERAEIAREKNQNPNGTLTNFSDDDWQIYNRPVQLPPPKKPMANLGANP